ncbi:MAG: hypothetical protein ONA90_10630 [candidate division KSB1 bacterium]|nr:hypothetical protein [candidate division KSB1 bacterium]
MASINSFADLMQSKFIPINVGVRGGDLPTRYFAGVVISALTIIAVPQVGASFTTLKLSCLLIAMSGTILLMAGLVFSQRTHYAGILLIPAPLLILWLANLNLRWLAVMLGIVVLGWIVQNVVTKRCGVNKLLGISSTATSTVGK